MFLWVKDVKKQDALGWVFFSGQKKRKKTVFQGGFLSGHKVTKRRVFWCALLWTEGERRKGYLRASFFSGQRSLPNRPFLERLVYFLVFSAFQIRLHLLMFWVAAIMATALGYFLARGFESAISPVQLRFRACYGLDSDVCTELLDSSRRK